MSLDGRWKVAYSEQLYNWCGSWSSRAPAAVLSFAGARVTRALGGPPWVATPSGCGAAARWSGIGEQPCALASSAAGLSGSRAWCRSRCLHALEHYIVSSSGNDAMLSVAASVSKEGTQLPGRYYPTPSHPTPPPRIWRRCHVECGCKCVKGRNAAARTLLSHPTPPHPPASGHDAMLSVATSVSEEGTQLPGRYYPTPPHPPASGDDAMLSVAASVTEEGTQLPGRYYPTPPHRIWRRCHVECGHKCVKGRNAAARTLLSHPTPPHRIWRRCHVECGHKCVRGRNAAARTSLSDPTAPHPPHPNPPHLETMPCWVWPQVCQRKERSCQDVIIPPHPTPHLETMLCWLWPQLWRGCWFLSRADGGWGMAFFWLWNPLVLVAESPFFGCGIAFFWLRNRFFGCGSAFSWLRKRVWFWLRKRRNMVSESEFIPYGVILS